MASPSRDIVIRRAKNVKARSAEIEGIDQARLKRGWRKAADLTAWLDALLDRYPDRILSFDIAAACVAGQLSDLARSKSLGPEFAESVIGAGRTHVDNPDSEYSTLDAAASHR